MQTTTRKIQTDRENPADTLVWPKVKFPIKIRPEWKNMMTDIHFTKEDLEQDERLAYILSKGQRG